MTKLGNINGIIRPFSRGRGVRLGALRNELVEETRFPFVESLPSIPYFLADDTAKSSLVNGLA